MHPEDALTLSKTHKNSRYIIKTHDQKHALQIEHDTVNTHHLSIYQSEFLYILFYLSIYLYISPIYIFINLEFYPSINLTIYLSTVVFVYINTISISILISIILLRILFSYFYSTTKHEIIQIKNHNLLCSLDPPNQSWLF